MIAVGNRQWPHHTHPHPHTHHRTQRAYEHLANLSSNLNINDGFKQQLMNYERTIHSLKVPSIGTAPPLQTLHTPHTHANAHAMD
jgi:hypothetical protein